MGRVILVTYNRPTLSVLATDRQAPGPPFQRQGDVCEIGFLEIEYLDQNRISIDKIKHIIHAKHPNEVCQRIHAMPFRFQRKGVLPKGERIRSFSNKVCFYPVFKNLLYIAFTTKSKITL